MHVYKVMLFLLLDPEYKRFLENYSCDEEKSMANPETLLGEIEAKTRELIGMCGLLLLIQCILMYSTVHAEIHIQTG